MLARFFNKNYKIASITILLLAGFITYSNTFQNSFHFDDERFIVNNLAIRNIGNIRGIWDFYPGRFIVFLTLALNYHFHQLKIFGYHLVNLVIHLGSALVVWWFVLLIFSAPAMKKNTPLRYHRLVALFIALIFLSHPLQTQAVTYIWQRCISLSSLFYLLSLCLYFKSRLAQVAGAPLSKSGTLYVLSLILAITGMYTKETAVSLPLMILLCEFYFFNPLARIPRASPVAPDSIGRIGAPLAAVEEWRKGTSPHQGRTERVLGYRPWGSRQDTHFNWRYTVPFLLLLPIVPLHLLTIPEPINSVPLTLHHQVGAGWYYFLTQLRVRVTYIRLLFMPLNQNLDYDYPQAASLFDVPTLCSLMLLAGIMISAIRIFSKHRLLSFGIFWFFLLLLPDSSIIPLDDMLFEHRLYLPVVGFGLFLVNGVYYFFKEKRIKFIIIILSLLVIFYSGMTYQRNKTWKDEFTLWNDAVQKSPRKPRPYNNRGIAYQKKGNLDHALSDYNKVIDIDPRFPLAYNNRGSVYQNKGSLEQALSGYNKAIGIYPHLPQAYNNRGSVYQNKGNLDQALSDYNRAIGIDPRFADAYYNRGNVYQGIGNFSQALSDYNKAIEIDPRLADVYINRGNVYQKKGSLDQAISDYNKAIEIDPGYPEVYINRGSAYLRQGSLDQAISDYNKAIGIDPGYAEAYSNRAVLYFKRQEYTKSWEDVRKVDKLGGKVDPGFIAQLTRASGGGEKMSPL